MQFCFLLSSFSEGGGEKKLELIRKYFQKKVIFFHEKSSAQDRTINSPYGLHHSFFFNRLTDYRAKTLVFFS